MKLSLAQLPQTALAIRRKLLEIHFRAQAGHIGTGLSSIDLLTTLFGTYLDPAQDRFVLSKGHGASALYTTAHHFGLLSHADFDTYYRDGTLLPAHPAAGAFDFIPAATGSLGHGLPIATGMAYAAKVIEPHAHKVVALLSDGECNEGSVWEAALFAGHHHLDNLTVIIDANGLQGFGKTSEVLDMEPILDKWRAFGFTAREINGHDFGEIQAGLSTAREGKPLLLLARTIKGKGVSFMENKLEWHYLPMSKELYEKASGELSSATAEGLK